MGIYLNPGNGRFHTALRGQIYVDKTGMLAFLNGSVSTPQKYICVSRPRRFGKTMAADMICAYYDKSCDSRGLFENREIAKSEKWDRYVS